MTLIGLVAGMVATIDQVVKVFVLSRLEPGIGVTVIDGFVSLRLGMNRGVAFGLFADLPETWSWLPMLLPWLAVAALLSLARQVLSMGSWTAGLAIGLILGGAAGNLIDRTCRSAVVDFVDVYWREYHWPAFNVADAAITVGVVLLTWRLGVSPSRGSAEAASSPSPDHSSRQ